MALILNEEQLMLKESAKGFLSENASIKEVREQRDSGSTTGYADTLWPKMVDMGWSAILVPEEFGGLDFGNVGMAQIVEETGRTLTASPLFSNAIVSVSLIKKMGSDDQKSNFLPKLASGQLMMTLAIDEEPHHNPEKIGMMATEEGDSYLLNGKKRFVIDGSTADKFIVVARTDQKSQGKDGLSLFFVDSDAIGVEVERTQMVDGRNSAFVIFKDAVVHRKQMLGQKNKGFKPLSSVLDLANIHLSAELLGICEETFDRTLQYLKQRKQFGSLIGSFQALQHRAAHWWSEIEMCKSIVLKALQSYDQDDARSPFLASIAKAKLCEIAELSTNEAIQMHGGIGMTDEYEIGFFIKRARPAQMLFGDHNYHVNKFAASCGY